MTVTTTTEIAGPVNVVFQQTLLRNAKARCPYYLGSTPGDISSHSGTFTVKWRRIENLTPTITPLAELTGTLSLPTRTPVQPTVNDLTAAVQKYGNFFFLNEEVDLINFSGQTDKLVEILGINAGQSLNRLQRNELEDNSTLKFAGDTITTASDVAAALATDASDIERMVNLLDRNSALKFTPMTTGSTNINTSPQRDAYWGICHSDVEVSIRRSTGFVPVEQYASQTAVEKGEFGSLSGVRFVSSPEASIDLNAGSATATGLRGDTAIDLYPTIIMGMDHHGSVGLDFQHIKEIYNAGDTLPGVQMISHARGSSGVGDPLNEMSSMGWKSWHAPKVLSNSTTPTTGEWGFSLAAGAVVI